MEKNEIFNYEDLKLYEAPPVAFVNLKEKNNNKIIKDNSFIILSSYSKNKAKNEYSELKIDINIETLRYQSKQILLDMMTFIQHFCHVSLVSPNYILNNEHLEIKKSGIKENQYSLSLKEYQYSIFDRDIIYDKNYYKNINSFYNGKFECKKCGLLFKNKDELENHSLYKCDIIRNNNDIYFNKKNNNINEINISNSNKNTIKEKNEIINKIEDKGIDNINNNKGQEKKSKLLFFLESLEQDKERKTQMKKKGKKYAKEKEKRKKEIELKREEELNREEEMKRKEEMKRQEELKRQEEEEKKKREEELNGQEEIKRKEELVRKEEEMKRKEEEIKRKEEELKKHEKEIKREEVLKHQKISKAKENYFYICYLDRKRFNNENDYIKHFSIYHEDDYPFYCEICKRGFFSYQALENHNFSKNHKP